MREEHERDSVWYKAGKRMVETADTKKANVVDNGVGASGVGGLGGHSGQDEAGKLGPGRGDTL